MSTVSQIAVLGAGAVGLASAVQLQTSLPNCHVTVIADKFELETTSDGAGGIFLPTLELIKGTDPELVKQWCRDSWSFYVKLLRSPQAAEVHAQPVSGYMLYNDPKRPRPLYSDIVFSFRDATEEELQLYGGTHKYGWFSTTLIVEPRWYLPWMMKKLKKGGATFIRKTVRRLEELTNYDVIVNCSGLGSRALGDNKTYSIRGQMVRVVAPHVKHFVYNAIGHYIIPCSESVVLGGTKSEHDYNPTTREDESKKIWSEALELVPALKGSPELWQWAGLRPHREPVRVQAETRAVSGGKLKIVHNYGQGGNGIALSWGSGQHAARLAAELLERRDLLSPQDVAAKLLNLDSKL